MVMDEMKQEQKKKEKKGYKCFVISGRVKIEKQKHKTRTESALKRGIKFEIMNFTWHKTEENRTR